MKIAILGSGYIGENLARFLFKKKHTITTVTNDPGKINLLNGFSNKVVLIKNGNKDQVKPLLEQNDVIVLTVSSANKPSYEDYLIAAASVIKDAAKTISSSKYLIYTGRTTVYGEQNGLWVDEETPIHPTEEKEKKLLETETILLSFQEFNWDICILRLAEVYGPGYLISEKIRNKSDYFSPGSGNKFTNMIHLEDIVSSINFAIDHRLSGIYNLADEDHQTIKHLLEETSNKLHLPRIQWEPSLARKTHNNYRVSNHKIKSTGYSFIHPHRVIN